MKFLIPLLCGVATISAGVVIPRDTAATTVTVMAPCASGGATVVPKLASSISAVATSSTPSSAVSFAGASLKLGPVSNPNTDSSNLGNIVPKSNLTLHYGSNDTSTPDSNAQISLQMKFPSVLLEDILSVSSVVCSDTGVVVTFNDDAGYKLSMAEWPASGNLILFTNHLGNCDAEFERGLFFVGALTFDEAKLTVIATAEKSDFQSTTGAMQISFGQINSSPTQNSTTGRYSNNTTAASSKRDITYDPTYSISLATSLPPNTLIASLPPYLSLSIPSSSFASTAKFSGHLDFNFWTWTTKKLYFDLDLTLDASLSLSASVTGAFSDNLAYAPPSLSISPISIPGILTLGPALDFSIGAEIFANAAVNVITHTDVGLKDGNVHVDFLNSANTAAPGWSPSYSASAMVDTEAVVEVNPFVMLGVELAVDFLGGVLDLSAGIKANATLSNVLTAEAGISAGIGPGGGSVGVPTGVNAAGVCEQGLAYKSDFLFGVTGFVTQFYSAELWKVHVPVFDKCWGLGLS